MSTTTFRRTTVGAIAAAAVFGLTACNSDDGASVTTPTGGSTAASTSTSTAAPEPSTTTTTESSTTEESTTTSEDTTTSESSSSEASKPVSGPTEVSDPKGTFKIGEPAVIKDDDDTYRLTPTSLEVAPDSVYNEARLKKSNGTVYYLKFDVTAIKVNSTFFGTNSINGLFFHPEIGASVKNAKRLYGDTDACDSESEKLAAGESASSCYMYQIPGDKVSTVVYNDYEHNIRWTK